MAIRSLLVTGAEGFVGRHLTQVLAEHFPGAEIQTTRFDITDRAAVEAHVREVRPDACVHLAAVSFIPTARRDPERTWGVNLHGTLNIARAILAHVPECALLFVSSAEIYGGSFRSGLPLDEQAPLAPLNVYSATKAAADLALGALASDGLRVFRLRPFNHIGPGQSANFAIPTFAGQIARIEAGQQEPVLRVGTLDSYRDFLDVRDVCAAYAACIAHANELTPGTILNIASGVPRRVGDVLDELLALSGVRAEVVTDGGQVRRSEIPIASGDARAAREKLHWAPRIAWTTTLRDVLDEWRDHTK